MKKEIVDGILKNQNERLKKLEEDRELLKDLLLTQADYDKINKIEQEIEDVKALIDYCQLLFNPEYFYLETLSYIEAMLVLNLSKNLVSKNERERLQNMLDYVKEKKKNILKFKDKQITLRDLIMGEEIKPSNNENKNKTDILDLIMLDEDED